MKRTNVTGLRYIQVISDEEIKKPTTTLYVYLKNSERPKSFKIVEYIIVRDSEIPNNCDAFFFRGNPFSSVNAKSTVFHFP